jgi:hypothetical protein
VRVKFQGSFTNGIYFSTKISNVPLRVNRKLGCMECRQSAVSNQSGLWLLRHMLLAASNCRVIVITSPFGFANRITVIGLSTLSGSALGGHSGKLRNSRCSCGNSTNGSCQLCHSGLAIIGLSGVPCGFCSPHKLKMFLLLGGGELGIIFW